MFRNDRVKDGKTCGISCRRLCDVSDGAAGGGRLLDERGSRDIRYRVQIIIIIVHTRRILLYTLQVYERTWAAACASGMALG